MRWFAVLLVLLVCKHAVAQERDWGQAPKDKALIAVVVKGAAGGEPAVEVSDHAGFVDYLKADDSMPLVKTYSVDPGVYSVLLQGSDQPVTLNLKAGAVEVVDVDLATGELSSENFPDSSVALQAYGGRTWDWLGQEAINPSGNKLIISGPGSGGTDDPGPMSPRAKD